MNPKITAFGANLKNETTDTTLENQLQQANFFWIDSWGSKSSATGNLHYLIMVQLYKIGYEP